MARTSVVGGVTLVKVMLKIYRVWQYIKIGCKRSSAQLPMLHR